MYANRELPCTARDVRDLALCVLSMWMSPGYCNCWSPNVDLRRCWRAGYHPQGLRWQHMRSIQGGQAFLLRYRCAGIPLPFAPPPENSPFDLVVYRIWLVIPLHHKSNVHCHFTMTLFSASLATPAGIGAHFLRHIVDDLTHLYVRVGACGRGTWNYLYIVCFVVEWILIA